MKNNYNKFDKNTNPNMNKEVKPTYGFYSHVLAKPFDSVRELQEAEAEYFNAQKAKEAKAAAKKSDAAKVEEAFKALNAARKTYKDELTALTKDYSEALKKLKAGFECDKAMVHDRLAQAEVAYESALRAFTEKYPEGYHLTMKDGDFETTISSKTAKNNPVDSAKAAADLIAMLFGL